MAEVDPQGERYYGRGDMQCHTPWQRSPWAYPCARLRRHICFSILQNILASVASGLYHRVNPAFFRYRSSSYLIACLQWKTQKIRYAKEYTKIKSAHKEYD